MHILVNLATDWVIKVWDFSKNCHSLQGYACMIELSEKQRRIVVGHRGNRRWHLMCLMSSWLLSSSRQTLKYKWNTSLSNDGAASGCLLVLESVLLRDEEEERTALAQGPVSSILRGRDGDEECGWWLFPPKEYFFASALGKPVCVGTFLFLTKSGNFRQ